MQLLPGSVTVTVYVAGLETTSLAPVDAPLLQANVAPVAFEVAVRVSDVIVHVKITGLDILTAG